MHINPELGNDTIGHTLHNLNCKTAKLKKRHVAQEGNTAAAQAQPSVCAHLWLAVTLFFTLVGFILIYFHHHLSHWQPIHVFWLVRYIFSIQSTFNVFLHVVQYWLYEVLLCWNWFGIISTDHPSGRSTGLRRVQSPCVSMIWDLFSIHNLVTNCAVE